MSLVPFLDVFDELAFGDFERDLFDDFGFGVHPHEITSRFRRPSRLHLLAHPRRRVNPYAVAARRPASAVKGKAGEDHSVGKDGFQVCMDVQQFKPNEITVKTVDNYVVVEGKHEEREDEFGLITRHFLRKYTLPKGFDPKDVVSTLSSDGILTVKAPLPAKAEETNERVVQIQQTGPAHLTVKSNPTKEKESVENGEKNNEKMED